MWQMLCAVGKAQEQITEKAEKEVKSTENGRFMLHYYQYYGRIHNYKALTVRDKVPPMLLSHELA